MSRKKVIILGGGVGGMSAAHELIERDFDVEVYERKVIAGGKARSLPAEAPGLVTASREAPRSTRGPALPGEHGFRFFPGFYKHVVDTMRRIPFEGGSVADNLVNTSEVEIAAFDRPPYLLPASFPRGPLDLQADVLAGVSVLAGATGVPIDEAVFFASKIWQILTSCEERRFVEYERVNWWDFIEAEARSHAYQKYFGSGITRTLVAAKARRASTKTIGDIFVQIVFDVVRPGGVADRVLNGPTNAVWIEPWLRHLRASGVVYRTGTEVRGLRCERGRIRSVLIASGDSVREVTADYFIAALPIERLVELLDHGLYELDPSLANLVKLSEYVEWMNGIQFYLTEDLPLAHGHTIYVDSPWALTSVSQAQFWRAYDLTTYGDGAVKGVLSVDISDWDVKGLNGKAAQNCSRAEIAGETWQQLKRSLNLGGEVLRDAHLHSWFLDPDIVDVDADADVSTPRLDTNSEPLLVNYVDTWRLRPEAVTRIPNFFLASDFVRTFTDLATMEAANEAARRAVNGVLRAEHSDAAPCTLWNLHEPELLAPMRAHDRTRFREGLPWHGPQLPARTPGSDRAPAGGSSAQDTGRVAELARASSDSGLRRLRIRQAQT